MNEKILSLLRNSESYVSGEEISRKLGVSRAGIWKHIQELRQEGYDIVAVPHLGYELVSAPDRLLPDEISAGLNTKIIGKQIYHYDSLDSTMDMAMDVAIKGSPEGFVVCAETQHKGRGRLGRSWQSAKHKGIYFSVVLRPKLLPLECPKLTLLSAICCCEAIRKLSGLDCSIKWPNDLVVGNKKIGGILTEMNAEADQIKFIIIGIGINVNTSTSMLPPKASSIKELSGKRISRVELLRNILQNIDREYSVFQKGNFELIIDKSKKYSSTLGHRVMVISHRDTIEGEALDIDSDGGLLIRDDVGMVQKIMAADIVKIR